MSSAVADFAGLWLAIPVVIGVLGVMAHWLTPAGGLAGVLVGVAASYAGVVPSAVSGKLKIEICCDLLRLILNMSLNIHFLW